MQGHVPARQGRANPVYTVEDIIAELRREIAVRLEVYPRLVVAGRLAERTAYARIAKLEEGILLLREYALARPRQGELFHE